MKICKGCKQEWKGKEYSYPRGSVYLCPCGCKKRPLEEEVETVYPDPVEVVRNFVPNISGFWSKLAPTKGKRVLVIPDLHCPFMHKNAIAFLSGIYDKYKCNEVVCLGDEIDYHKSSFHSSDPDSMGATEELELAAQQLGSLAEVFPHIKVCSGNHSQIPKRQAYAVGLSKSMIKSNKEVLLELGAPVENWEFADHFVIDDVKYVHGTGRQAKARMMQDGCSIVQGHFHSKTYVEHLANDYQLNFAMQLGALIDDEAYAFEYGRHFAKSHKNCGVVIEGVPIIEYMRLGV